MRGRHILFGRLPVPRHGSFRIRFDAAAFVIDQTEIELGFGVALLGRLAERGEIASRIAGLGGVDGPLECCLGRRRRFGAGYCRVCQQSRDYEHQGGNRTPPKTRQHILSPKGRFFYR